MHSSVIMTPTGYLTDEAWTTIVPMLCKGLRHKIRQAAATFGIDGATADKLLLGLTFDGFKVHTKMLMQLTIFRSYNIIAAVEDRDSSQINQAFDRLVAKAGKKRAAEALDDLLRSHIMPVIDKWSLILVGLSMLRDCDSSNVWEASFLAVNMHPLHRISFEDWMDKIQGHVVSAAKFEDEVINMSELLPNTWLKLPLQLRQKWLKTIKDDGESWDVNLLGKLRKQGMPLQHLANIFKVYHAAKHVEEALSGPHTPRTPASNRGAAQQPSARRDRIIDKGKMIYHLFKVRYFTT